MSKYLDRFIPAWEKTYQGRGHSSISTWLGNKNLNTLHRTTFLQSEYTEEEYKGFSLIIVKTPVEVFQLLDKATNQPTNQYLHETQFINGESYIVDKFYAYAWRIGGVGDDKTELEWLGDFADLAGICQSTSFKKTLSMARKHLDTYDVCYQVHDRLKAIADERLSNELPTINVLKGEEVFIHAHGRRRKGIVVGTTGSRFIVSYVTPSTPTEIKTKTVNLHQIKKGTTYEVKP